MEGMFFVWGCAVLDDRMQYVKVGNKVRITFEGETTNKRNQKVNLYRVDVAENEEMDENGKDSGGEGNDELRDPQQFDSVV